jgi:diguanylate cyclase (GGDEF)-like protein
MQKAKLGSTWLSQLQDVRRIGATSWLLLIFSFIVLLVGALVVAYLFPIETGATKIERQDIRFAPDPAGMYTISQVAPQLIEENSPFGYKSVIDTPDKFWLAITRRDRQTEDETIEIRVLRAEGAQFWAIERLADGDTLAWRPLTWSHAKGGIAIHNRSLGGKAVAVVGYVKPLNIARPVFTRWTTANFEASESTFQRIGGALFGALLTLAGFSAVIAGLNRERTFLLFAAWLITTLRVAAINSGWDPLWLGLDLPRNSLIAFSKISLAAHALFTVALFRSLLHSDLVKLNAKTLFDYVVLYFCALLVISPALQTPLFMPMLWASSLAGMGLMMVYLARILIKMPTSTSVWYALSWGVTFGGLISEVLTATGLVKARLAFINSESGALATALLTAVALSARMRTERIAMLKAQESERDALGKLQKTFEAVPSGLFSLRTTGAFEKYNPAFAQLFSLHDGNKQVETLHWDDCFGEGSFGQHSFRTDDGSPVKFEIEVQDATQGTRIFGIRAAEFENRIEGSANELTAQKRAENQLRFLADHDPLTGLLNRRGFDSKIEEAMAHVQRGGSAALAYVDLDRFKLVNDLFGHAAGDQILTLVSNRLKSAVHTPSTVARVGGDEFIIIYVGMSVEIAKAHATVLLDQLRTDPYDFQGKAFSVAGSIGVVPITHEMSLRDALASCDRACSEAKRLGGSQVVALEAESDSLREHMAEIRLVAGMRASLPIDRFFTLKQPIVSLNAPDTSLCYEVLIRMRDADGSVMAPARFIGAAERNGMMSQIDRWVLQDTIDWLDANPEHRDRLTFLTLNLSGASLNDERFISDTFSLIRRSPKSAAKICFEITESVALYDIDNTKKFIDHVKSYGSRVALDDFGAGYTSFSYLKQLPGDLVKIDGSFIRDINADPHNYAITRAIVDLCHELGMEVVAEWAEDGDTIRSLSELAVDYAQGYALSLPLDSSKIVPARNGAELIGSPEIRNLTIGLSRAKQPRPRILKVASHTPEPHA